MLTQRGMKGIRAKSIVFHHVLGGKKKNFWIYQNGFYKSCIPSFQWWRCFWKYKTLRRWDSFTTTFRVNLLIACSHIHLYPFSIFHPTLEKKTVYMLPRRKGLNKQLFQTISQFHPFEQRKKSMKRLWSFKTFRKFFIAASEFMRKMEIIIEFGGGENLNAFCVRKCS